MIFQRKQSNQEILHELLPKLLTKKSPSRIPMTGEAAKTNDCWVIYFGDQYLVKDYILEKRTLKVCTPDSNGTFTIEKEVTLTDALKQPIHVTHYYKNYWQDFTDINRLYRDYNTQRMRLEIFFRSAYRSILQCFFNRRPLWLIRDRMELLEFITQRHLGPDAPITSSSPNSTSTNFSAFQLMTELRSDKWIYHPNSSRTMRRLDLLLASFVDTGDLKSDGVFFELAPRAMKTLDSYQENERRHKDAIRTQSRLFWLTIVIAGAAIVQAYFTAYPKS